MRRVVQTMGMPLSLDIPGCSDQVIFDGIFWLFNRIDEQYSSYKPGSEVSRMAHGQLEIIKASSELREIVDKCHYYENLTEGYFSANYGGSFDPNGYVKGWAIARAGRLLEAQGQGTYLINAGGDILARSNSDHRWQLGVQHPKDFNSTLVTVRAAELAMATSGSYVRGDHILDPHTGLPNKELLSLTVLGADIIEADVFATAAFAMGLKGLRFIESQPGYEAIAVLPDLSLETTIGLASEFA